MENSAEKAAEMILPFTGIVPDLKWNRSITQKALKVQRRQSETDYHGAWAKYLVKFVQAFIWMRIQ